MERFNTPSAHFYPFSVNHAVLKISAYAALGFFLGVWYVVSGSVCFVAQVAGGHREVKLNYHIFLIQASMTESIAIIFQILIVLYSIILHEVAHGAMAEHLGDDTAKRAGRLTLNPLPHIDPVGTILLPLVSFVGSGTVFGWARPVPYNPMRLRGRYDELKVALAGPATNIAIAFVFATLVRFNSAGVFHFSDFVFSFLIYGASLNIWLALFNLVPIPPLDGSKVLFLLISKRNYELRALLERYGLLFLFVFFFFGTAFLHPIAMLLTRALIGV